MTRINLYYVRDDDYGNDQFKDHRVTIYQREKLLCEKWLDIINFVWEMIICTDCCAMDDQM